MHEREPIAHVKPDLHAMDPEGVLELVLDIEQPNAN
jgi:hypothetical protein